MILKNAANRRAIVEYLQAVTEDDFIGDVVIPVFNQAGYATLRINTHGPGEHGKDVIFYKHIPSFFDNEYVVVQAKCQDVTTANVTEMSNQLIRALRTPIKGASGGSDILPNYVVFFNSRRVSNDAHWEFPYLIDGKNNIKVLNQENVCEMMMEQSIVPEVLRDEIIEQNEADGEADRRVREILLNNKAGRIEELFENTLFLLRNEISDATKKMAIEYIFNLWSQDRGWDATVKPMKWLDKYFDFLQPDQYKYLSDVLEEYVSSTPSFKARPYTESVISKLTVEQILGFRNLFFYYALDGCLGREGREALVQKLLEFEKEGDALKKRENESIKEAKRYRALMRKRKLTEEEKAEAKELRGDIADRMDDFYNRAFKCVFR